MALRLDVTRSEEIDQVVAKVVGAFGRRISSQILVDLGRERRGIRVINIKQPLERGIFGFFAAWLFVANFAVKRFGFLGVTDLALTVRGEQHYLRAHFFRKLLLRFFVIAQELRELAGLKLQL